MRYVLVRRRHVVIGMGLAGDLTLVGKET